MKSRPLPVKKLIDRLLTHFKVDKDKVYLVAIHADHVDKGIKSLVNEKAMYYPTKGYRFLHYLDVYLYEGIKIKRIRLYPPERGKHVFESFSKRGDPASFRERLKLLELTKKISYIHYEN